MSIPPLQGLRVLDLARVLACPFSAMILAELGAEVIKVEQPGSGDESRSYEPVAERNGQCERKSEHANQRAEITAAVRGFHEKLRAELDQLRRRLDDA